MSSAKLYTSTSGEGKKQIQLTSLRASSYAIPNIFLASIHELEAYSFGNTKAINNITYQNQLGAEATSETVERTTRLEAIKIEGVGIFAVLDDRKDSPWILLQKHQWGGCVLRFRRERSVQCV